MGRIYQTPRGLSGHRLAVVWCLTVGLLASLGACDDDNSPPDTTKPEPTSDSGVPDAGPKPDAGAEDADVAVVYRANVYLVTSPDAAAGDAGAGETADLLPCETVEDCPSDDALFCNGTVTCQAYVSRDGAIDTRGQAVCVVVEPCPRALVDNHGNFKRLLCDEAQDRCECNPLGVEGQTAWYCNPGAELPDGMQRTTDTDQDNVDFGEDCDDADPRRYPSATEVCDEEGLDEDCDLSSAVREDRDGDGAYAAKCLNLDPVTGLRHPVAGFDDCNDANDAIHFGAKEICDDQDNDCDGKIDEDAMGTELGLRQALCADNDGDGYVLANAEPQRLCLEQAPARLVACPPDDGPFDCDDDPRTCGVECQPGLPELCDGYDNNCNGRTDEDEQRDIQARPSFSDGTLAECRPVAATGRMSWAIVEGSCPAGTQWCDQSTAYNGCETDITTRFRCGSCQPERTCDFACQSDGPEPGCDEVTQLEVGRESACAITARGRLACWGRGAEGQLGNGSRARSLKPTLVNLERVHKVGVGLRHMCAIAGENRGVLCWGADVSDDATHGGEAVPGLLGSFEAFEIGSDTPVEVNGGLADPRLTDVQEIEVGYHHTCVVTSERHVMCWGDFHYGRLGFGPAEDQGPDFVVDDQGQRIVVQQLSLGLDHSCGVAADGRVLCWGGNSYGQLGYPAGQDFGGRVFRTHAAQVPGLTNITAIEAGTTHTCAIDQQKRVWCWGSNVWSELGREDTQTTHLPQLVPGAPAARSVSSGSFNTCVIADSDEHSVWCWGARFFGFLGLPLDGMQVEPTKLDVQAARLLAASETLCVLSERGVAGCLGYNDQGQLGNGALPTQMPMLSLTQIAPLH